MPISDYITPQSVVDRASQSINLDLTLIEPCENVWDEQTITGVTASFDTEDYVFGSGSAKFTIDESFTTGLIGSQAIENGIDLHMCDNIYIKFESSQSIEDGDYSLLISDSPNCKTPLESLAIPAGNANQWESDQMELAFPENLSNIVSVGLYQNTSKGANIIHIDYVQGFNSEFNTTASEVNKMVDDAITGVCSYLRLIDESQIPTPDDDPQQVSQKFLTAITFWAAGLLWNQKLNLESPEYMEARNQQSMTYGDKLIKRAQDYLNMLL